MRQRCYDKKYKAYRNYGARGIRICPRWRNFENFLLDMGKRPSNYHTIERIDNSKGYKPGNCKWSTRKEQNQNKRNTIYVYINGEKISLTKKAELLGLRPQTVYCRYKRGDRDNFLFRTLDHPSTRNKQSISDRLIK